MRRMFEFRCQSTGERFEKLVDSYDRIIRCKCGDSAVRLISAVKCVLDPLSGHFPSATDKWAKAHEDGAKISPQ